MAKWVTLLFDLCNPRECDPEHGLCSAVKVCKRKLLEQEEPFECPALLFRETCKGCGDCVHVCPRGAILWDGK